MHRPLYWQESSVGFSNHKIIINVWIARKYHETLDSIKDQIITKQWHLCRYNILLFLWEYLRHDSMWCCGHSQYLIPEYNEMRSASSIKLCQEVLVSVALCMRCHSAQSLSPCYLCVLATACWGIMVQVSHSLYISLTKKDFIPYRWKYFEQNSHLKRTNKCFHHGRLTPLSTVYSPVLFDCEIFNLKKI